VVRTILTLSGRVQTVGFRDAVRRVAARHPVAGTVRNLSDGERLEIDAEGEQDALEAFIADVLAHPPRYARVQRVDRANAPPRGLTTFTQAPTAVA
jgi:hydrogenase maturation protein HypF